jgi:hypothetical protein
LGCRYLEQAIRHIFLTYVHRVANSGKFQEDTVIFWIWIQSCDRWNLFEFSDAWPILTAQCSRCLVSRRGRFLHFPRSRLLEI